MVEAEEKKRIDNFVKHLKELSNPKMVVCQDVFLHNSKRVPNCTHRRIYGHHEAYD